MECHQVAASLAGSLEETKMKPVIEMKGIVKRYFEGKSNELEILHGLDLMIYPGEFVAIVGESGSGKSTLMNILGALDKPTEGTYFLDGINIGEAKQKELSKIRNEKIGFVFQTFNLIARENALKNVELPMMYAGKPKRSRIERAKELLTMVGMDDRMKHLPNELSGGQKQRVAIARALSNNPSILLADEPTGALDSETGQSVMNLFHQFHKEGKTVILITHSKELAEQCERIITLKDGSIISERRGAHEHS